MGQFDRTAFKQSGETILDSMFGHDRNLKDTMQYANTMKNGSADEKIELLEGKKAARIRLQRSLRYAKGGKGRAKKLSALKRFEKKELSYIDSKLHLYSRKLIDICLKTQSGNLLLVNKTAKEESAKEDELVLRNWSYCGLIEKIR